jgi:hypothetical protein
MRAKSIVIASVFCGIVAASSPSYALEAMSRSAAKQPPVAEVAHKVDNSVSEIDLQSVDIRLASLEPRDVLPDHDGLRAGAHRAAAFATPSGIPTREATLITPAQRVVAGAPQRARATSDYWLMGLVAVMLVAYQLRRKHRFLRPQPFSF